MFGVTTLWLAAEALTIFPPLNVCCTNILLLEFVISYKLANNSKRKLFPYIALIDNRSSFSETASKKP
jgi:hypothetical protein